MAFNQKLAQRVREILQDQKGVTERKMFGGLAFMVKGNMCCGVEKDQLMLRVGPEKYEVLLTNKYAKVMDFTGRPLKGFLYIVPEGIKTKPTLTKWIHEALDFVQTLPRK